MPWTYWILIAIQMGILTDFVYNEYDIPYFMMVDFKDLPVPYEMTTLETSYVVVCYLVSLAIHFFIVEEIFRRRNGTIIWDKAALRIAIQLGFTVFFYFLYIVLFSNLQTRHHIETQISTISFFKYRISLTLIYLLPTLLCLLLFKRYALWKNIVTLLVFSTVFSVIISFAIYYYQTQYTKIPFNDIQEERRLISNVLSIDFTIGLILWRELMRNKRLDKLYQNTI